METNVTVPVCSHWSVPAGLYFAMKTVSSLPVTVLDPPPDLSPQQVRAWRQEEAGYDSRYATLYYPWIRVFDPLTGRPRSTELSYTDVFGEALMTAATRRSEVCAITAAMASSTGLLNFAKEFPDRFFECGIAEANMVSIGAGLASAGSGDVMSIGSPVRCTTSVCARATGSPSSCPTVRRT